MWCAPVALPTFATAQFKCFLTVIVLLGAYFLSVVVECQCHVVTLIAFVAQFDLCLSSTTIFRIHFDNFTP